MRKIPLRIDHHHLHNLAPHPPLWGDCARYLHVQITPRKQALLYSRSFRLGDSHPTTRARSYISHRSYRSRIQILYIYIHEFDHQKRKSMICLRVVGGKKVSSTRNTMTRASYLTGQRYCNRAYMNIPVVLVYVYIKQ